MKDKLMLLIIAILPILLLGLYIYHKDKNKEPKRVLVKMFIGGILSAVITMIISFLIKYTFPEIKFGSQNYDSWGLLVYAFLMISMVEEFSKWIIVYFLSYHEKEFDELYDMIVYSAFVALGFAAFENIIYVFDYGVTAGILRIFLAVPAHTAMAIFMGYFLSLSKLEYLKGNHKSHVKYMFLSIVVPILLHGFYDYTVFNLDQNVLVIFIIYLLITYIFAHNRILKLASSNDKLKTDTK